MIAIWSGSNDTSPNILRCAAGDANPGTRADVVLLGVTSKSSKSFDVFGALATALAVCNWSRRFVTLAPAGNVVRRDVPGRFRPGVRALCEVLDAARARNTGSFSISAKISAGIADVSNNLLEVRGAGRDGVEAVAAVHRLRGGVVEPHGGHRNGHTGPSLNTRAFEYL